MYDLPFYKEKDEQVIKEFIDQYPFAFVSGCDADHKPVATQAPVFIEEQDGKKFLRGHIMKNMDHHKAFLQNPNVLVVFTGRHTYVSGTWYSNPRIPSTWNYMSVHLRGNIRFLDDDGLISILRKTTLHFENYNPASTTIYDNLPPALVEGLRKAIVAFEIEVQDMRHIFKLSQDRDEVSYHNIIRKLKEQGEDGQVIAAEMEKRIKVMFPNS
jgi:transcriptional regulator